MTTGVEAVDKHAIYLTTDQPTTGAQIALLKDESEQVAHKKDTQAAVKKPAAPIATAMQQVGVEERAGHVLYPGKSGHVVDASGKSVTTHLEKVAAQNERRKVGQW
ncbi:hypothetical protein A4A49_08180 [Nicotiana attenuata]|uniref:Uncharacterized protein n=1 Tax=Nicotiana attenuata TaxID=49451 RepID=A0A314KVV5_NICAT|nr:hypothetical protein A4A49_08180 [Nicotiana attenuata]